MASVVIGTSTDSNPTGNTAAANKVNRTQNDVLWVGIYSGSEAVFRYSTDNGATWALAVTGSAINIGASSANFSFFIDVDDYAHIAAKDNFNSGYITYYRGTPNAARTGWTWTAASLAISGASFNHPDIVVHREGTGWQIHLVAAQNTASNKVLYRTATIASDGALGAWSGAYLSKSYTANSNWGVPSIDFHHTGDGKTVAGGTPHLYVAWNSGIEGTTDGTRFRRAAYSAGSWTWGTEVQVDTAHVAWSFGWMRCLFDGTRVIVGGMWYGGGSYRLRIVDVALDGTTITSRANVAVSAKPDYLIAGGMTYDGSGNVYLFGEQGNSSPFAIRYRKFTRSTVTLEAAVTITSTSKSYNYVSCKRSSDDRVEWVYSDGTASPYTAYFGDPLVLNTAPNAPSLVAPTNGSTIELSGATLFDWTFSDPDAGDTQSAWAFRRKISGAASYEYWNVSTGAWQSTEVWNSGSTSEYTFAAGTWANGNTYNWSVATKDAVGATGPYAGDWTVTGGQPPSVTVNAPTGTVVISRPTVQWTFNDPAGGTQVSYHLKVYDAATYGAAGFDPNTTAALHDTGEVTSSDQRSRTIQYDLQNGTTYRAYMRVKDNEGIYSQWAYSQFSVALSPPNTPSIVVTDDPTNARVIIDVQGHDNLLTENQASIETDTSGWSAVLNCTIARSTTVAADGVASLSLTSAAAGDMRAQTGDIPVVGGQQYTGLFSVRAHAGAAVRTVHLDIIWLNASGSFIREDLSAGVVNTTAFAQMSLTLTSPATAGFARIRVRVLATAGAGEIHYIDKASLQPGSVTTWARGGLAASTAFIVERSIDGGITWETVRGTELGQPHDGAPTQKLRVLDREMGPGTTVTYRAKTTVEV